MRGAAILLALLAIAGCAPRAGPSAERAAPGALSAMDLMRAVQPAGFERALLPRRFDFPADHGPHPGFRTEWWYWTGNLADSAGRPYGYQLTIFRQALQPGGLERDSAWAARDVYLGHLAIADGPGGRFLSAERFARAALGLAGAEGSPLRVWLEDWQAAEIGEHRFRLRAAAESAGIDLDLDASKPVVLQGEGGLSRKGAAPGNASYYYSLPRLATTGRITVRGSELTVSGWSWMDREWSTSALSAELVGWDWFALQLDDGSELMLYRLRRTDGTADPYSSGLRVAADGAARRLAASDFALAETAVWASPATGVSYPAAWRIELASEALSLEIRPLLADQEVRHRLRYWEGSVAVSGEVDGRRVSGRGYVELVGYPAAGG